MVLSSQSTPLLGSPKQDLENSEHAVDLRRQDFPAGPMKTSEPTGRLEKLEQKAEKAIVNNRVFQEMDHLSQATHFMTKGHTGAITCVCADMRADCIVTGSKDGTMRIWRWDSEYANSFVLTGVIEHGTAVTTVACIEASGFVASGTDRGAIFYIDTKTLHIDVKKDFHRGTVHDLSIMHSGIETCFVTLDEPNNELLDNLVWESKGMKVVNSVVFEEWNDAHPSYAIKENHFIAKANGTDLSKLDETKCKEFIKEEMAKKKGLKLKVLRYTYHEKLIASGGDYFAKVVALKGACSPYSLTVLCELLHGCRVSRVKFLEHDISVRHNGWFSDDLRLLTSSVDGTRLWNINDSSLLLKIESAGSNIRGAAQIHGVCIPDNNKSMLISVLNDVVSVWNLHKAENLRLHSCSANIEAEMEYQSAKQNFQSFSGSQCIASSLSGDGVFSVVGQKCIRWSLGPAAKCGDCGAWRSDLESHLPVKHMANQTNEFKHSTNVTAVHVFEDPDVGGVLLCGCEDGRVVVWDIGGDDAGEVIAHLRSLSRIEFFGPTVLMLISFVQVSSFAFGPAVPWHEPTHGHSPGLVTGLTQAHFFPLFNGDREFLFYATTLLTLAVMTLFIAVILSDARRKLYDKLNLAEGSVAQKRKEKNRKRTPKTDKSASSKGKKVWLFQALVHLVDVLIWTCCTVLVVPMSNSMVQAVACVPDEVVPSRLVLGIAPEVLCFEGRHRDLVAVILVVAPVFFFLLFPFAVVHGDSEYVQRSELLSIQAWKNNAMRKATIFHLGPRHPMAEHVFVSVCTELTAKIALPVVAEQIHAPLPQMKVVTTIGILLLIFTLLWKPMIEGFWNGILIGLRLWTVCAMACACLAIVIDDPERPEPLCALGACTVSVFVMTLMYIIKVERTLDHTKTIRMSTVNAKAVRESTAGPCQAAA